MAIAIIQNKTIVYKSENNKRSHVSSEKVVTKTVKVNQQQLLDDIYGEEKKPIKVVDVDVKRHYNLSQVDSKNIKSDIVNTCVNNKVDKLRRLRRGN